MARFLLLLLSLLIFSLQGFSQKVNGTVIDTKTGEPLFSASVVIKGTGIGATTDFDGKFSFSPGDKEPPFTLVVSYIGYKNKEIEVNSLADPVNIELATDEVVLEGVTVVEQRLTEKQKESALTVESMDIIAIKETPSGNFYEGLGNLKGVDLTSASLGFKVINTRGFNSTSPVRSLQLIDGVDNQSPGLNFSLGNFLGAPELDVLKVDLIQGASSAFYGPNAFNGVISMTTKDPFVKPGLSAQVKVGERNLAELALRYAQVFQNKDGVDKFAYKLNLYYMRAHDWEADNDAPTPQSTVGKSNPGGYDAVNRYGDENLTSGQNNATSLTQQRNFPGLGRWHRTGYWEEDLVDYDSRNLKASAAFHYRLKPDVELIAASNFGTGTTVYQGDNRYSLKNILFMQNRLELKKKDKYFLRAYATHEDAGDSYDAVFTAFLLQDKAKDNNAWQTHYRNYWSTQIKGNISPDFFPTNTFLPGFPDQSFPYDTSSANAILSLYHDSLVVWHQQAEEYANTYTQFGSYEEYYEPGSERFDSLFNDIISRTSFEEGGTKFYDKSALYHIQGEYKFEPTFMDIVVGGNYRLYTPNSNGTIFSDTLKIASIDTVETGSNGAEVDTTFERKVIRNMEYGVYAGVEKKFLEDKLKFNATARLDKNQNFDYLISPAVSGVYSPRPNHTFRLSFSSAIRNPTLADQFLHYNVGRAILLGNVSGYDSLVTIESLRNYFNSPSLDSGLIEFINIDPVQPEKVKTIEVGYRAALFNRLYLDANYYFSFYRDFIGYKLAAEVKFDEFITNRITDIQAYRIAANADDRVTTQGFSIGLNYYFKDYFSLNGNYSWNRLDKQGSDDPIIPAFNTPEHKFNIGVSGRDIVTKVFGKRIKHWGFNTNFKWVEGFRFEGSPQFTGFVPSYYVLDAQINKYFPKIKSTFKLGASNITNNLHYEVFGGPFIGRLGYFSILVELEKKDK